MVVHRRFRSCPNCGSSSAIVLPQRVPVGRLRCSQTLPRERERESPSKDLLAVSDVEHTANALHLLVRTRGFRIGRIWLKDFRGFFVFHQHTVHTIQCTKKEYIYIYIMRNSNSWSKLSRPSLYDRGALQFFRDRVCVCMCSSCSSWQFVFLDAAHAHRQTEQSSYIPFVFRACLSRNPPLK